MDRFKGVISYVLTSAFLCIYYALGMYCRSHVPDLISIIRFYPLVNILPLLAGIIIGKSVKYPNFKAWRVIDLILIIILLPISFAEITVSLIGIDGLGWLAYNSSSSDVALAAILVGVLIGHITLPVDRGTVNVNPLQEQ